MVERQALMQPAPERPELDALLERLKTFKMTDEMLAEQRVSFIYGNAPESSRITRQSAEISSKRNRLLEIE